MAAVKDNTEIADMLGLKEVMTHASEVSAAVPTMITTEDTPGSTGNTMQMRITISYDLYVTPVYLRSLSLRHSHSLPASLSLSLCLYVNVSLSLSLQGRTTSSDIE